MRRTGSGKTLAFTLPCLLRHTKRKKSPACLVLAPTRELALQTHMVMTKVAPCPSAHACTRARGRARHARACASTQVAVDWKIVCIFGGESRTHADAHANACARAQSQSNTHAYKAKHTRAALYTHTHARTRTHTHTHRRIAL
jgi:superfamily II DNA/RNA helicase